MSPDDLLEHYSIELREERARHRIMAIAWHEARKTVCDLNRALRRKNRQITRQNALIVELRAHLTRPAVSAEPE